jgi:hypothetical protein
LILAIRASLPFGWRGGFLQHLDDIARRQQRQARLIIHTWVSNERIANITVTWWCQDRQLRPDSLPVAIALVIFRSALDQ